MSAVDRDINGESLQTLGSAQSAVAVTPSDADELQFICRRLWIGGAGSVSLVTAGGDAVTYANVPAGSYLSIRARQVNATGTTASSIVAEF